LLPRPLKEGGKAPDFLLILPESGKKKREKKINTPTGVRKRGKKSGKEKGEGGSI